MIPNDIRQFLSIACTALNKHEVEYMLIGGIAVAFYGYSRPSGVSNLGIQETKPDLDFWYNPRIKNYYSLLAALREMGKDTSGIDKDVFDRNKTYLKIQHKTFKTEFLPQMKGLESFEKSYESAKIVEMDGYQLPIIGFSDLIKNKESINREIDRKDIAQLKKVKKNKD